MAEGVLLFSVRGEGVIFVLGPNPLTCKIRLFAGWPAEALFSPETSIFIAFSKFSKLEISDVRAPPPHYFKPHFTVSPFKDPKKCPKNSPTRGANSTLFFDPYFRSVFWPFLAQKCETAIHLISIVLLVTPETTIFLVFFCPSTKKEEDRRRQEGTKFPFLTSQDSKLPLPPPPEMLENIGRKIVRPLFGACIFDAKKCRNTSRMTENR